MTGSAVVPLQPAAVVRDEAGSWIHPEVPDLGELMSPYEEWAKAQGLQLLVTFQEDDALKARAHDDEWWTDERRCASWEPSAPTRDCFLISIHDTEDGPCAWWLMPARDGQKAA